MKKLFAVMMALCLMLTAAAFAEGTDTVVINWADHEAEAANIQGVFGNISTTGLKMFVPDEFENQEISEETMKGGTILVLKSNQEEKAIVNAQVMGGDIATVKATLEQQGATVRNATINGIPAIMFTAGSNGVVASCFGFSTTAGMTLIFTFTNADQEPYTSLYKVMASSIQLAE